MDIKNTFAGQYGQIMQNANKAAFEVQFDSVQRGLLRQQNKEIQEVNRISVQRDVERLEKRRDALAEKSNEFRDLQFDLETNANRFLNIRDLANNAVATADADGNGSLSDEEVTALKSAISEIQTEISRLKFTHQYPEFTDGNLANRLRQQSAALDELTAITGIIDDPDDPATNDNRSILTTLETISSQAGDSSDTSTILVGAVNQIIIDTQSRAFDLEADLAALTTQELARREAEIEEIEIRYGNLIRSISLAFEVQSGYADTLVNGNQFEPPAGSILNIFS